MFTTITCLWLFHRCERSSTLRDSFSEKTLNQYLTHASVLIYRNVYQNTKYKVCIFIIPFVCVRKNASRQNLLLETSWREGEKKTGGSTWQNVAWDKGTWQPLAFSKKPTCHRGKWRATAVWQRVDLAYLCAETYIRVSSLHIRLYLNREWSDVAGYSRSRRWSPWRATRDWSLLDRDLLCASRVAPRSSRSPRPFVSHEYLNWILKAQNHRTDEPSLRVPRISTSESGTNASNFEADFGARWSIQNALGSRGSRATPWKSKNSRVSGTSEVPG